MFKKTHNKIGVSAHFNKRKKPHKKKHFNGYYLVQSKGYYLVQVGGPKKANFDQIITIHFLRAMFLQNKG